MKKLLLILFAVHLIDHSFGQNKSLTENFLNNVGDTVLVLGKIYGGAYLVNVKTKPTFLNLGDSSPTHRLIIRIEPEDRSKFPSPPETYFLNKVVQVKGILQEYKGTALVRVSDPEMLQTEPFIKPFYTDSGVALAENPEKKEVLPEAHKPSTILKPSLRMIVPDSLLQSTWIKSVQEKAAEESKRNVRVVTQKMDLKTAPYKDAPVIAELQPNMLISIVYTSKKWSYISIGTIDGFNNVSGFIKHNRFKHLKKVVLN